jgi:hypothetical protein
MQAFILGSVFSCCSLDDKLSVCRVQATTHPFEITYGTGAVAGSVAYETLTMGSGDATIKVPHQGFGMVYDSSMDFLSASCDGLFVRLPPLTASSAAALLTFLCLNLMQGTVQFKINT